MKHGIVKWFDAVKGYGYITGDDGNDIFVHYTGIVSDGYKTLDAGVEVNYSETTNSRGLIATDVVKIA